MRLSSPQFEDGGMIPAKFTCDGDDKSPTLVIEDLPEETQSMALTVLDPDAPERPWLHWLVYDLPVTGRIEQRKVPGKQGLNDFKKRAYGGPCPPSGTHRYTFTLYALRRPLGLPEGKGIEEVQSALEGQVIESAQLTGHYSRTGS